MDVLRLLSYNMTHNLQQKLFQASKFIFQRRSLDYGSVICTPKRHFRPRNVSAMMRPASCSVLLNHKLAKKGDLYKELRKYGQIKKMFYFKSKARDIEKSKFMALVEFEDIQCVRKMWDNTTDFMNNTIPQRHRHFYYTRERNNIENEMKFEEIEVKDLSTAGSITAQMKMIHDNLSMSELDTKLRFFVCDEIQQHLRKLFYGCQVRPFGSSVNGLGRFDGDLDMVILFPKVDKISSADHLRFYSNSKPMKSDDGDLNRKRLLGLISKVMKDLFTFCGEVIFIRARIPIIKFKFPNIGLECDLSMDNRAGTYMSELLQTCCELDNRLPLLVFTLRVWAKQQSVSPGLSNFMIVMLVVHFLQVQHNPVLPSIFEKETDSAPMFIDNVMEIDKFAAYCNEIFQCNNHKSPGELLEEFFKYYATFNFSQNAISILRGHIYQNISPEEIPMFIDNPVELDHNICKNVKIHHVKQFQKACEHALEKMQDSDDTKQCGLLKIINENYLKGKTRISYIMERNIQNRRF